MMRKRDQFRQRVVQGGRNEADVELQHHALGDPLGHRTHLVNALQNLTSLFKKVSARLGQRKRSTTIEQPHPQLFLELLHLAAQRRLRNVELFSGATERAFRRDSCEITQMTELHGIAL